MTVEEVVELKGTPWRDYVRVEVPAKAVDRRTYIVQGEGGDKPGRIFFVHAGDRYFVVRHAGTVLQGEVVGRVMPLSSEVERTMSLEAWTKVRGRAAEYMVDTDEYREALIPLGIFSGIFVGIAVWNFFLVDWRRRDARRHPLFKELQRYGDPESVREALDGDVAANGKRVRDVVVGRDWLMRLNKLGVTVMYVGDAAWMYLRRRGKVMWVWPRKADWVLVVRDVGSITREYFVTEAEGKILLEELGRRAPWAETGFTAGLERMWVQNREGFLVKVMQRRKELAED